LSKIEKEKIMGDLVGRIPAYGAGPMTLEECRSSVQEAHDFLVRKGTEAVGKVQDAAGTGYWGAKVKRVRVFLPHDEWPTFLSPASEEHNLVEVINQCATMERLLDALEWAQGANSGLSELKVVRCHPTTSSSYKDKDDHDLVLVDGNQVRAKFEISDVSSDKDANQKEKKDLISLGVLKESKGAQMYPDGWPEGRLFLVVSEEFSERLRKPNRAWLKGPSPYCHYTEPTTQGTTKIFEVRKGAKP
jgi:hypothetical protein